MYAEQACKVAMQCRHLQRAVHVWMTCCQWRLPEPSICSAMLVQVASACVMSFAHGANDVANAMGPFAAVYNIWKTSSIPSKSTVPTWILVVGTHISVLYCMH